MKELLQPQTARWLSKAMATPAKVDASFAMVASRPTFGSSSLRVIGGLRLKGTGTALRSPALMLVLRARGPGISQGREIKAFVSVRV